MLGKTIYSRRKFLKTSSITAGSIAFYAMSARGQALLQSLSITDIISSIGDIIIPSTPGKPGYTTLETHGITVEVMKKLSSFTIDQFLKFDEECKKLNNGISFIALPIDKRTNFLMFIHEKKITSANKFICEMIYNLSRISIFTAYYQNFPEIVKRDSNDIPILASDDKHQIINPNTTGLYTGWDRANFTGPWGWEQEDSRRKYIIELSKNLSEKFHRFIG
jgi:ABC-type antimicrobial peptide transport system permease subunit